MNLFDTQQIIGSLSQHMAIWIGMTLFFTMVAAIFPAVHGQKIFRKDYLTDLALFFVGAVFYSQAFIIMLHGVVAISTFYYNESVIAAHMKDGTPALRALPFWAQGILYLVISDFILYWLHRWYHSASLWRWHKLHHSATEMDWLTMARFHPFNLLLYSTFVSVVMTLVGFDPAMLVWLAPANLIYSAFVHANWDLEFPRPLNYILASPIFHRWHHTHTKEGGNSNFAPTFPVLDVLFGTYYHPVAGSKPVNLGLDNPKQNLWW